MAEAGCGDRIEPAARGVHIDRTDAQRETLADLIKLSREEVTDQRPGEPSRIVENARLNPLPQGREGALLMGDTPRAAAAAPEPCRSR